MDKSKKLNQGKGKKLTVLFPTPINFESSRNDDIGVLGILHDIISFLYESFSPFPRPGFHGGSVARESVAMGELMMQGEGSFSYGLKHDLAFVASIRISTRLLLIHAKSSWPI